MIVVDTNVLSELFKPAPNATVVEWFARYPRTTLFTTTITQAEVLYDIQQLPDEQRRVGLAQAAAAVSDIDSAGARIWPLSFDRVRSIGARCVPIRRRWPLDPYR